jgi:hypothetical protein
MSLFNAVPWGSILGIVRGVGAGFPVEDRFRQYGRYLRAYEGWKAPALSNPSRTNAQEAVRTSRLRYNFNRPIVNLGAAFLAGSALKWRIDVQGEGEEAQKASQKISKAAFDIWDRSGSDRTMLEAARSAGIYGDLVGLAVQDQERRAKIEFVCPDICTPQFQGSDAQRLVGLQIAWEEETPQEQRVKHLEEYSAEGRRVLINGEEDPKQAQSFDGNIPAVWIRNLSIKGRSFGISDLDGALELVEEYDHVQGRRAKIIDYYAGPSIVWPGASKSDIEKSNGTMFFPPKDCKPFFLEWSGTAPDLEQHLDRIRNDLAEVTQVPAVAFGRQDSGLSTISGVALKILYGPLLSKTNDKRASWGPGLEYLMWLGLRAEGHDVPLEAVNVVWPDPLPQNVKELVENAKTAADSGLKSKRTLMGELGVENADQELAQVQKEQRTVLLKQGLDAGLSLSAAALEAGVPEAEIPALIRSDVPTNITQ